MDFLDPAKKRQHSIFLMIGYILMSLLVIFGTYFLVLYSYGYNVDRKSGEVVQSGLLFVTSAPNGAEITLNGQKQRGKTNSRLVLPEAAYDVRLSEPGYRDWQGKLSVQGGQVVRLAYPRLLPQKLVSSEVQSFDSAPSFGTQSPDQRWVLLSQPGAIQSFVQYDLASVEQKKPLTSSFSLPADLLTATQESQSWELVEWSADNKHVLLKHLYGASQEFIVLNRDDPGQSINVNRELGQNPTQVALRDKKFDKFYLYDHAAKSLKSADLKTKTITGVAAGVLSFKSHGADVLLYSTVSPEDPAKARITLSDDGQDYTVRDIPLSDNIPLEIARFSRAWYVVIGSDGEHRTYIYKDPQAAAKKQPKQKPATAAVIKSVGPISTVAFSGNARLVMVQSGQHFGIYDAETKNSYGYDLTDTIDPTTKPVWMDGHRMLVRSSGKVTVLDFDNTNKRGLVASSSIGVPTFFDKDYTAMYNLSPSVSTAGKQSFTRTELRLAK